VDRLPPHVWFVDFEFSGTSEGERPTPICCVAREWHSGQTYRLWENELGTCPYGIGEDSVLVAYAAAAELGCHLALGWPLPANVLCLHAEYRCYVNIAHGKGETPRGGLLDALDHFGVSHSTDKLEKKRLQERCGRGGPWEPGEREEILAYCTSDVTPLPALLEALLPHIDVAQALERGRFVKCIAHMERTGIPIDVPKYKEVISKRSLIMAKLITPVDKDFKVYTGTTFKQDRFAAYLAREGIDNWPKTPSGRLGMKTKALEETLARYPQVKPLFGLKAKLDKLRKCSLKIGGDGFARAGLKPFVAVTGRSQPGSKEFIFGQAAWLRFLIAAPPDFGIASFDWSGQEVMIAAAMSGDENLMKVANSADPHLTTGKMFGIIPEDGTEETHKAEREKVKPFMFGTNYGAGAPTLAKLAGVSEDEAKRLRILHYRAFPKFWRWIGIVKAEAYNKGMIETSSGWRMRVPPDTRPTTLMDWPMQAIGGDMMRLAVCEATERCMPTTSTGSNTLRPPRQRPRRSGDWQAALARQNPRWSTTSWIMPAGPTPSPLKPSSKKLPENLQFGSRAARRKTGCAIFSRNAAMCISQTRRRKTPIGNSAGCGTPSIPAPG
jgi:DNA polymerase I